MDGKPLQADVIVICPGAWMAEMFPRTIKPISAIMGINVLYTSTPDGSDAFDMENMPCWIDHGQGSFGIPSSEGSGVKAAVVIPHTPIDINNDERLIEKASLAKTRQYIRHRLPGLEGQRIVDSKFNQVILTPMPTLSWIGIRSIRTCCLQVDAPAICSNTGRCLVISQQVLRWGNTARQAGSRPPTVGSFRPKKVPQVGDISA